MSNQPENSVLLENQFKKKIKVFDLAIIFFVAVSIFFVIVILFFNKRDRGYEKGVEKELKTLALQVESMKKERIKLDENANKIIAEIDQLKSEKEYIYSRIANYQNQLDNIKNKYEKISNYAGISNDSLRRIFTARFGK